MIENFAFVLDVFIFFILSIAWFFLSVFHFYLPEVNEPTSLDDQENEHSFIDNQLLKAKQYYINDNILFGNEFIIDDKVFTENINLGVSKYREFELYSLNLKMNDHMDTSGVSIDDDINQYVMILTGHCKLNKIPVSNGYDLRSDMQVLAKQKPEETATFTVLVDKEVLTGRYIVHTQKIQNLTDQDACLQMYIQPVPYGIIVNSNVYLTNEQWNTLYNVSEDAWRCAVCDVRCEVTEHSACAEHKANLDRYKPLEKYDLTVTRKINNNYHCGVCNLLFDESLKDGHFSSKHHEEKMLFAINKVSDIMYDYNIHNNNNSEEKKDTYHFSAKAINNNNIELTSEDESDDDYAYNDSWNPFNSLHYNDNGNDDYYCEEPAMNLEHSYASMARKPKTEDLPAVLEVDLGNKKVTVKFDSWNMVISPKLNRFYCMACTKLDHVRRKAEHCRSEEHLARLDECTVVDEFEKYLVRLVNDKLYHCGHCNNLQLIHEMEDHIESQHPHTRQAQLFDSPAKKISTPIKTNPAKVTNEAKHDSTKTSNETNGDNKAKNDVPGNINRYNERANTPIQINAADMRNSLRAANSNLEDIVICAYGSELRISKIAFNVICQGDREFYCGLCEVSISKDNDNLKVHMNDIEHLTRLQSTPFIEAFNVHLFREIRDALHCGLCNELIQIMPEFIIKHKYLEKHIISLSRALGNFKDEIELAKARNIKENNNRAIVSKQTTVAADVNKIPVLINGLTVKPTPNAATTTKKDISITNKNVALNNIPSITSKTVTKIEEKKSNAINQITEKSYKNATTIKNDGPNTAAITKQNRKDSITKMEADIITAQTQSKNEEFVVVKNGVKEELNDDLDDSFTDDYDYEEYVYVKLGNNYIKITNTSYHTLVDVGDGGKYCFVCSSVVDEIQKHIESRGHTDNMEKFKFLDKYNEDLLRQFYLIYHCSICNVVITRKQLNHHLSWPTHTLQTENTKISSKKRKNEIKAGTKQITVSTQKENIYLNEKETDIKIYLNVAIEKELLQVDRKNKIVIFNDNVLKISFDGWHSLTENSGVYRCKVCQCDFEDKELGAHVGSEWHKGNLDKFDKQYSPALIRKINDTTLNCVVCNTEVSNQKRIVSEHILGKKHVKHYDTILRDSSVANSYADCDEDVLML